MVICVRLISVRLEYFSNFMSLFQKMIIFTKIIFTITERLSENHYWIPIRKNFNQGNKDNAHGFQGFNDNIFNEYSEVSKKLIATYEKQIEELKAEIQQLKNK